MVFYIWNMHIYMTNDTLKVKEPENESTIWIKSRGFVIISRKSQKMDVECDESETVKGEESKRGGRTASRGMGKITENRKQHSGKANAYSTH